MRKSTEQEHQISLAIRDVIARNPMISVLQLQAVLKERGFKTAEGNPLHWHYLAKLVRKLNREKVIAVDLQKVNERLAETKERYRVMVEMLWRIIDYRVEYLTQYLMGPPSHAEKISAANTLIKLDLAILKAEMDLGIFDRKLGTLDLNLYRATPLDPEKAAKIAEAFKRWGIDLNLTEQRPKPIQALPANAADHHSPENSGQGV